MYFVFIMELSLGVHRYINIYVCRICTICKYIIIVWAINSVLQNSMCTY